MHPCLVKVKSVRRGGWEKAGRRTEKTRSKHLQHLLQPSWVSLGNWRRQSGEVTVSSEWRRWGAAASYLPPTATLHHFPIFTLVLSSMHCSTKFSSQTKINRGRERKKNQMSSDFRVQSLKTNETKGAAEKDTAVLSYSDDASSSAASRSLQSTKATMSQICTNNTFQLFW